MAITISIDKAGRVVVPKPLREKLGLEVGDNLLVDSDGDQITLRPVRPQPLFGRKDGIWVYLGPTDDFDIVDFIDQEREKRAREFLK
jgi:AbrB family looped-hinge helix DNA binding protein